MFPQINHINDLLPFIEGNPQFRVQEQPNGTTVVCYMLQDEDTFKGEHDTYYKECRGITFHTKTGEITSRTLHKFQNVGENDETQPHLIPWDKIVRVMDKRDGSMITPVMLEDGSIVCKTKKTFTSAEAIEATKLLHSNPDQVSWVRAWLLKGFTPTFEFTSPEFPIVLLYEKPELTLLQIRHNKTGKYVIELFLSPYTLKNCPFPVVPNLINEFKTMMRDDDKFLGMQVSWEMLKDAALTRTGIEGWILQADDGRMWKVKTKWYCDLHHAVTFTRYRDVARSVIADQTDDLKAAFALTGRSIQPIIDIEKKVWTEVKLLESYVDRIATAAKKAGMNDRQLHEEVKGFPLSKFVMRAFQGRPSEFKWFVDFYRMNYIHTYSLKVIPTAVQNEDVEPLGEEDETTTQAVS